MTPASDSASTTMEPSADAPVGVRLDCEGPVATVTLCRPETLNAQTPAMWSALGRFGRQLTGDIRIVVLRGEGRAFSAGLDRSVSYADLAALPPEQAQARIASFQEGLSWLRRPDLVTIAGVQGHAIGAGFQLALACDFRVLAEDAQLSMAEVQLGLVPDLGGTKRLVELVGYGRALEICLTGRRITAFDAERIGLANLVVAATDLDTAVRDLSAAVLAAPRDAVVETKSLIASAAGNTFAAQEGAERGAQVRRIHDLAGLGE